MTRYSDIYRPMRLIPSELVALEIAMDELRCYAEMLDHDAGVDKADYEKYQWAVRKLQDVLDRAERREAERARV